MFKLFNFNKFLIIKEQKNFYFKIKMIIYIYIIFFILFSLIFNYDFVPLNSYIPTFFEFKDDIREYYYKFSHLDENADMILNFGLGQEFTTKVFFYEKEEQIKKDSEGNFIDYNLAFNISSKTIIIKSENLSKIENYFIIFQEKKYYYKDFLTIHNDGDIIKLNSNAPFFIKQFYKYNNYTFEFSKPKDKLISIWLATKNNVFQESILIYINDNLTESIDENNFYKNYSKGEEDMNFKIIIINKENEYSLIDQTFLIYESENNVTLLENNNNIELNYVSPTTFNFYIDINDYDYKEENIVTFNFDTQVYIHKMLNYIYAKVIEVEKISDDYLLQNLPNENDNQFNYTLSPNSFNSYQLFFRKNLISNDEKKVYLIITLNIQNNEEEKYFIHKNLSVTYGERMKNIELNNSIFIQNLTFILYNYMTVLLKLNFENNSEFAFLLNSDKDSFYLYNNSLFYQDNETYINKYCILKKLQVINKNYKDYNSVILVFFSSKQEIKLTIESTLSDIYYIDDFYKPVKSFSKELLNCNKMFYYIGNYDVESKELMFYFEEIYGNFTVYYKNNTIDTDDNILIVSEKDKNEYKIKNKTFILKTFYDIVGFQCEYPGYFNAYIYNNEIEKTFEEFSRNFIFFYKNTQREYSLPQTNQLNLELYSPLKKQINITIKDEPIVLNETQLFYRHSFDDTKDIYLLISSFSTCLIDIRISQNNLYKEINEGLSENVKDRFLILNFKNSIDYKSVNLEIKRNKKDIKFSYYLGKGDYNFAPLPNASFYEFIKSDLNLIFSNPYDKYPHGQSLDESDNYFLAIQIESSEEIDNNINLVYNLKETYEEMKLNEIIEFSPEQNKKLKLNINKDIKEMKLISHSCDNKNDIKKINIYQNDDIINEFYPKIEHFQYNTITNYNISNILLGVEYNNNETYHGIQLMYFTEGFEPKQIDDINKNPLNINKKKNKISWDKIENFDDVKYEIYIIKNDSNFSNLIDNDCFLIDSKNLNSEEIIIKHSKNNNLEINDIHKISKINVVACINYNNIPLRVIYHSIEYNPENHHSYLWFYITFPIVLIVVIFIVLFLLKGKKLSKSYDIEKIPHQKLIDDDSYNKLN